MAKSFGACARMRPAFTRKYTPHALSNHPTQASTCAGDVGDTPAKGRDCSMTRSRCGPQSLIRFLRSSKCRGSSGDRNAVDGRRSLKKYQDMCWCRVWSNAPFASPASLARALSLSLSFSSLQGDAFHCMELVNRLWGQPASPW